LCASLSCGTIGRALGVQKRRTHLLPLSPRRPPSLAIAKQTHCRFLRTQIPYPVPFHPLRYFYFRRQRHDDTAESSLGDGLLTRLKGVAPALEPSVRHGAVDPRVRSIGSGRISSSTPDTNSIICCWGRTHVESGPRGARSSHGLCGMQCGVCGPHSPRGQVGEEGRCDVSRLNRNTPKSCAGICACPPKSQSRRRQSTNTARNIQ